jgi:hypothetical protein
VVNENYHFAKEDREKTTSPKIIKEAKQQLNDKIREYVDVIYKRAIDASSVALKK